MVISQEFEKKLKEIYNQYASIVHARCVYILKSEDEAWDVTQEVFIKLIKSYDTIQNKKALLAWLLRSGTNRCISQLRKNRGIAFNEEIHVNEKKSLSHDNRTINKTIIEMLLKPLDKKTREILFYTYVDGYTQEEIAELTGMGQSTIRKYLTRFRRKARKWKMSHDEFEY
jgi:RNA polymerase sigma-70 factor (ECF subfamily)